MVLTEWHTCVPGNPSLWEIAHTSVLASGKTLHMTIPKVLSRRNYHLENKIEERAVGGGLD